MNPAPAFCPQLRSLFEHFQSIPDPHQLMKYSRGHWSIENKLHLPRDMTCKEDGSRIGKHHGARSLASLKSLAIGLHALGVFKPTKSARETLPKMNR